MISCSRAIGARQPKRQRILAEQAKDGRSAVSTEFLVRFRSIGEALAEALDLFSMDVVSLVSSYAVCGHPKRYDSPIWAAFERHLANSSRV